MSAVKNTPPRLLAALRKAHKEQEGTTTPVTPGYALSLAKVYVLRRDYPRAWTWFNVAATLHTNTSVAAAIQRTSDLIWARLMREASGGA